jgi:hypothetical protein
MVQLPAPVCDKRPRKVRTFPFGRYIRPLQLFD